MKIKFHTSRPAVAHNQQPSDAVLVCECGQMIVIIIQRWSEDMSRKTILALVAAASIGLLSPTIASARGGFGGGGFTVGRRFPRRWLSRWRFPGSRHWARTRSRPRWRLCSLRLPVRLRWLLRFAVCLQRLRRWRLLSGAAAGLDSLWLAFASSPSVRLNSVRLTLQVQLRPALTGRSSS